MCFENNIVFQVRWQDLERRNPPAMRISIPIVEKISLVALTVFIKPFCRKRVLSYTVGNIRSNYRNFLMCTYFTILLITSTSFKTRFAEIYWMWSYQGLWNLYGVNPKLMFLHGILLSILGQLRVQYMYSTVWREAWKVSNKYNGILKSWTPTGAWLMNFVQL